MTDDIKDEGGNWVASFIEGGLPQLLAGPAGKAISRLIGVGVDIPSAYLESFTQDIRDKTAARSELTQAIAQKAAAMAVDDAAIMDRALGNMLSRTYRAQNNKDAVAAAALEDLKSSPAPSDSQGPSDDWMNKFERYAEDASSDDLRIMFGKLLAGEIRRPGNISPTTLHFASMLDGDTAQLIDRVLPSCIQGGVAIIESLTPKLSIADISYIEQSGFWSADKTFKFDFDNKGLSIKILDDDDHAIALRGNPNTEVHFEAALLSRAGTALASIVKRPFDLQAFANLALKKPGISNCYHGQLVEGDGRASIPNPTELFRND